MGEIRKKISSIRELGNNQAYPILGRSLLGGVLMFLYLALLYVSIGLIATGIALTLFFGYPIFTSLFSWIFLGKFLGPLGPPGAPKQMGGSGGAEPPSWQLP